MLITNLLLFLFVAWWFINAMAAVKDSAKAETIEQPEITEQSRQPQTKQLDRLQLEKIARDCLTSCGARFDTWTYCRSKTDIELMDIIAQHQLNR